MYEIRYSKRAMKDLEVLKRNKKAYKRYLEKEKRIAENPKRPNVPQGDFSELTGNRKGVYRLRINQKHRVFYTVADEEHLVYIDEIEFFYEGIVHILQTQGHDLK